jgi:hypothetical protein
MTWGSDPSYGIFACPYCGADYIDDANPPTHFTQRHPPWRERVRRVFTRLMRSVWRSFTS